MGKLKIGLLPLYVALYDESTPQMRPHIEKYLEDIVCELNKFDVSLVVADICRLESEFEKAVKNLAIYFCLILFICVV